MKYDFTNVRNWVSGERFVGREKTCCDLVRYVRAGTSCAVVGLRRIGKTSVLKEVKRRLCDLRNVLAIDMDLEGYTSDIASPEACFYADFANMIDSALIERGDFPVDSDGQHTKLYQSVSISVTSDPVMDSNRFLSAYLHKLHRQSQMQIVLLLDEFDACAKAMGASLAGFLKRFRTLVDDSPETGMVFILATSRAIKMLEAKTLGDASTLDGILNSVHIKPFPMADFEKMCDISEAPVVSESRLAYFSMAFGHPFLSGLCLHYHNELYRERGQEPSADDVMEIARCDIEKYFDELYNVFSAFPVPKDLSSCGINNWFDCLVWREMYFANIPPHIVEIFKKYGFWDKDFEMPSVLHDFLARCRVEVWPELKRIETRMRRWVGNELKKLYGGEDDWFMRMELPKHGSAEDPWRDSKRPFQKVVDDLRARRVKEMPGTLVAHLDCTYLDDLMNLVLLDKHWHGSDSWRGFGSYFDDDKQKFRSMLISVGKVRNPEAHFVDYPEYLKSRFVEADRYLSSILDRVEKKLPV